MGKRHVARTFALARALALRASEQGEEIVPSHHAVGDFHRAQAGGQVFELRTMPGGHRHGIQHLFRTQPTRTRVGKVLRVVLVPPVRHDAQLVGLRTADGSHELAQIVSAANKLGGE